MTFRDTDDRMFDADDDGVVATVCLMPAIPVRAGYGGCSSCGCQAYAGNGPLCGNCQHQYSDHY